MSNLLCLKCGSYVGTLNDDPTRDCGCGNKTEFLNVPDSLAMHEKTRKIFFLIGPTGAGKNFVTGKLKDLGFENVPSVTTRGPREGEIPGEDYVYISTEAMERLKDSNLLCEYIKYGSGEYGVSREILLHKLWLGDKNLIIIVEPNGYEQMLIWFERNYKLIKELKLELSTIFLNVDRVTRFFNLIEDAGFTGMYNNAMKNGDQHLDVFLDKKENIDAFTNVLNRLVRNGDSIAEKFIESKDSFKSLFRSLEDHGLGMNHVELKSRDEVSNFIIDLESSLDHSNINTSLYQILTCGDVDKMKTFHQKLYNKIKVLEGK